MTSRKETEKTRLVSNSHALVVFFLLMSKLLVLSQHHRFHVVLSQHHRLYLVLSQHYDAKAFDCIAIWLLLEAFYSTLSRRNIILTPSFPFSWSEMAKRRWQETLIMRKALQKLPMEPLPDGMDLASLITQLQNQQRKIETLEIKVD